MEIIYKNINDLIPYGKNPRKNSKAVKYVANSIKEFGFKVPIVIDSDSFRCIGKLNSMGETNEADKMQQEKRDFYSAAERIKNQALQRTGDDYYN